MTVLVGTTIGPKTEFLDRWLDCCANLTYKDRECVISSDVKLTLDYIEKYMEILNERNDERKNDERKNDEIHDEIHETHKIKTLYFDGLDGIWNGKPNGLVLMGVGKEKVRNYVARNADINWLLLTDSDIEFPPDTIERFLNICADSDGNPTYDKPNIVWTENLGACFFMHRNVCDSVHFWSTICLHQPFHIEENYEVLRQLEHYNNCVIGQPKPFRIMAYRPDWLRHRHEPFGRY